MTTYIGVLIPSYISTTKHNYHPILYDEDVRVPTLPWT